MIEPSWYSLLPPLLAIILAITTRQVFLSLGGGIWLGYCLVNQINPIAGLAVSLDGVVGVFEDAGNTRVIIFTLVVGGLIATMEKTGGVKGFIAWLDNVNWVNSARRAQFMAWFTGIIIFVESNITLLVAGSVSRPLFDRYRVSREKLAYLIDSTSAPICILIPFNAWGAFNIGLVSATGSENPLEIFLHSIPLNLYAICAVVFSGLSIWIGRDIGPMAAAERRTQDGMVLWPHSTPMVDQSLLSSEADDNVVPRASFMLAPIIAMVASLPLGLFITGNGDMAAGSGSTSVLWSVLIAVAVAWGLSLSHRAFSIEELIQMFLKGAGGLMPVATVLLLSIALGDVANQLESGRYIAGVVQGAMSATLLLPLIFLVSAAIAFSVGSSWGTFALMIPVALPAAVSLGYPEAPFLAAVLSGAIFGDHASPISDTTIVASMAASTDHIDHVRTQLPYALLSGAVSLIGFVVMGAML